MNIVRLLAATFLIGVATAAVVGPLVAPHDPGRQHADFPSAPPVRLRVVDNEGKWRLPFVYPLVLTDRLERRYTEDRTRAIAISSVWNDAPAARSVFLLGTDPLGRDLLSRLLLGTRTSMGMAATAAVCALVIGVLVGALAGYRNGAVVDEIAMRVAEMILVMPALYIVLALRAAMPLVLEPRQVFVSVAAVLALLGWPVVARGVRAIVASERNVEYVEAARACGASVPRLVFRHLLPATFGFVATQAAVLVPAFVIAEATLSYAGLGFAEPTPSWGTMLQDAGSIRVFADYPWLLAPAGAMAAVSWAMHSLIGAERAGAVLARAAQGPVARASAFSLPDRARRT